MTTARAYRFRTSMKDEITVTDELVDIRFPEDFTTLVPYARDGKKEPGLAATTSTASKTPTPPSPSRRSPTTAAFLLSWQTPERPKIVITEADLEDYPGMYLYNPTGGKALRGNFAPYPAKEVQGGHNELQLLVTEREDFIARTSGTRTFPWRVFAIAGRDIPAGRQRHGLPSRRTLARGGRLVDQTRQGGLGLVEHLEPLRRGLQVGNQQRNL